MKILQQIWHDIRQGENIDLYLTVLIAVALAILNLFGITDYLIGPITLAVLALLSISSLVNRRRLEDILERLGPPENKLVQNKLPPNLEDTIKDCRELWIIGIYLGRTLATYYPILKEKLQNGDSIKVLITDPNGISYPLVSKRSTAPVTPEEVQHHIRLSLSTLCALREISSSNMEVRIIDYMLPFGVFATDLGKRDGIIIVEYYPFKMETDSPVLVVDSLNKHWFDFYRRQIKVLWDASSNWNCIDLKNKGNQP